MDNIPDNLKALMQLKKKLKEKNRKVLKEQK